MIVRPFSGGVHLVAQPDHARLGRRIMEQCPGLSARPRRDAILLAIGEHDDGWREEDALPAVDPASGRVVDFVAVPVAVRQRVWPRSIAQLEREPWAAALVAHHAWTVYDRFRADPEWTAFFTAMEAARDVMLRACGLPLDELVADYAFLRIGDLISLAFCTGSTGELRYGDWTVQPSGSRVVVTPELFGGAVIPLEIQARKVHGGPPWPAAEWQAAWSAAGTTTLRGEVAGSRS